MTKKITVCLHDKDTDNNPAITLLHPNHEQLLELNSLGYGVFETVNSFTGDKRRKENLLSLDAVYADMDVCKDSDGTPEKEREERKEKLKNAVDAYYPPSVYVVTKNGFQPKWWIDEPYVDEQTQQKYVNIVSGIIEFSKEVGSMGDPVKDVSRILRMPGYYHMKSDPYLVTEVAGSGKVYTLDELQKYFWKDSSTKVSSRPIARNFIDEIDIRIVVIDVWKEKGHIASFDKHDHLVIDGVVTATFKDHLGKNFIATSSSDYPAKGNAVTYVAETLGISTKDAYKWLVNKYGKDSVGRTPQSPSFNKKSEQRSGRALVRCMADVQPQQIQWLWPGRLALGKLVIIAGDPGLGKSLLTANIAATVSQGRAWPHGSTNSAVGSVILLSAEDDPGDTIRPRLDAADANCNRIHVLQAIYEESEEGKATQRTFSLQRDLPVVEELLNSLNDCRLVVIDPISAYLDGAESHNNTDVRGMLAPLADLANRHKVTVLMVQHMNKNNAGSAMYRAMGSIAFVAAARSAYLVTKDANNPDIRLVLPVKNNLAKDTTGLAYTIVPAENQAPTIRWEPEPVTVTADEALLASVNDPGDEADWVVMFLKDQLISGPAEVSKVNKEARKIGISEKQLRRAREKLGVTTTKSTYEGGWVWGLAGESAINPEGAQF